MLRRLRKLRGKSLAEVSDRARQRFSDLTERSGIKRDAKMPTDKQLFERLSRDRRGLTPEQLFQHFRRRSPDNFYASMHDRATTIAELRRNFPDEEAAVIARADRICSGRFDLLGYRNLYFRADFPDWHFDPISQRTSPRVHWSSIDEVNSEETGDKKVLWELNRHQYFTVLGRAYWLTANEKYAETWARHLADWQEHNPPKFGVNWLSSLELSFRSMSWIWSIYFFKDSPAFTPEVLLQMLKFLYLNARHLETYLSTYFSPNTHLTGEALGLYFIGSLIPEFEGAKRWRDLGYKILMDALDYQVRADGTYVEQSSHYHRYTTDFYSNLMILRELEGSNVESKHREKLDRLLEFLMKIQQPNGETPLFGDDDGGRLYFFDERAIDDFRPTLALGAVLMERGDLKFLAGKPSAELLWLLGEEGVRRFESLTPIEPKNLFERFEIGGYFTARSSWTGDADQIIIQCGPHGFLNGGHAHADALSFVISVDGVPIFIDSGTYNYTSDLSERDRLRSSDAHNCLTVDGRSSSIPGGPFSWKTTADSRLIEWRITGEDKAFLRGTHDGFADLGVGYERSFDLDFEKGIQIEDSISSTESHLYELHFVLAPEFHAEVIESSSNVVIKGARGEAVLELDSTVSGSAKDERRWRKEDWMISAVYGQRTRSEKLIFSVNGSGSLQIITSIKRNSIVSRYLVGLCHN